MNPVPAPKFFSSTVADYQDRLNAAQALLNKHRSGLPVAVRKIGGEAFRVTDENLADTVEGIVLSLYVLTDTQLFYNLPTVWLRPIDEATSKTNKMSGSYLIVSYCKDSEGVRIINDAGETVLLVPSDLPFFEWSVDRRNWERMF